MKPKQEFIDFQQFIDLATWGLQETSYKITKPNPNPTGNKIFMS